MKRQASNLKPSSRKLKKQQTREEKEIAKKEIPILIPRLGVLNQDYAAMSYEEICSNPNAFRKSFQQYGLVVVTSMMSSQICEESQNAFLKTIKESYEGNEEIDIKYPEKWYNKCFPQNFSVGIVKECVGITSSLGAQQLITQEPLQHCFRELWEVDEKTELLSSFDTVRIVRCSNDIDKTKPNLSWLHIDQNPANGHLQRTLYGPHWERACIQSQIILTDQTNPYASGSFSFLPKSHLQIRSILQEHGGVDGTKKILGIDSTEDINTRDQFFPLSSSSIFYQQKEEKQKQEAQQPCILALPRGSVIFWVSDLVHANWPGVHQDWVSEKARSDFICSLPRPFRDRKNLIEKGFRSIVYFVSMIPKSLAKEIMQPLFTETLSSKFKDIPRSFEEFLKLRRTFFLNGKTSKTHWIPFIPDLNENDMVTGVFHPLKPVNPTHKRASVKFSIPQSSIYTSLNDLKSRSRYGSSLSSLL